MLYRPVSERVLYARTEAGLSQHKLALMIGTDRLHILKWERGYFKPSDRGGCNYPEKLAQATGFPAWFFRDGGLQQEAA